MTPIASRVMDMRNTDPLQHETEALVACLETVKPNAVLKLERDLAEARRERAEAQNAFGILCAEHRKLTPGKPPGADFIALQKLIEKYDANIGALRAKLTEARLAWAQKSFFKATRPHLDSVIPALEQALRLIEAAREHYTPFDRYTRDNSLGAYMSPRSDRMDALARDLKRFLKDQAR